MIARLLRNSGLLLLCGGFGNVRSMTPWQALGTYLTRPPNSRPQCTRQAFEVQIDAALPKLKKQGSMSGLKIVSKTGRTIYRGLKFTGDHLVKTAVIARFLAIGADPPIPFHRREPRELLVQL